MYDILDKIRNYHLFTPQEIDDWNNIFFSENRDDSLLQPTLNVVLDRWSELSMKIEIHQELNFQTIVSYMDIYQWFISLIILN